METTLTMFISLVATSGVFTSFLCLYAFLKRKEIPGAYTFVVYTATQAVYIFAVAFQMASDSLFQVKIWTIFEYVGIAFSPAIGLLIVLQYIGKSLSYTAIRALFVIPVTTFAMVVTNDWHHLFYKEIVLHTDTAVPQTDIIIGQYYIIHGAFTFGCMLAAVVLLVRRWRYTKKAYRLQLATLIVGQFVPMTAAFIYLMGLTPYSVDPVPMVICITSAMYIWAIVSSRIMTIVPIAKDHLFESMREGAIVLDFAGRLIDFNHAISRMFPGLTAEMIGMTLDEAWIRMSGSPFPVVRSQDGEQAEFVWRGDAGLGTDACAVRYYQLRSSVVRGRSGETIGSLLMLIDVTEQRLLQDQLKQLAYYDGLTKLLNRTEFIRRSKIMLESVQDSSLPACIVLFDIDHFKMINDTYGHDVGDRAIQHVVAIAKQLLEDEAPNALFARYGGEEFVIALPLCALDRAAQLAEGIRAQLAAEPMCGSAVSVAITASFGISQAGVGGYTLETLLRDADMALYQAKRAGRNQVQVIDALMALV